MSWPMSRKAARYEQSNNADPGKYGAAGKMHLASLADYRYSDSEAR